MLHRLAAEVQPCSDLGIRKPLGEKGEHLTLPLREYLDASGSHPGSLDPELPQKGGGVVGIPAGAEILERGEGQLHLCNRDLGLLFG